jgi:murein DD-endopeptidase MepM/ murein hydrolase activator NlpD
MKLSKHHLVLINSRSISRTRKVTVNILVSGALMVALIAVLAGLARLSWFASTYAWAKVAFCNERRDNARFVGKLRGLETSLTNGNLELKKLSDFEDSRRLAYGMNPISADIRRAGTGGMPSLAERADLLQTNPLLFRAGAIQESLSILMHRADLQNATFDQLSDFAEQKQEYLDEHPTVTPACGTITSEFGYRFDPISGERTLHQGLDIANDIGTPIFAPADGIVKEVGILQNYGMTIVIEHAECSIETVYAHLSDYAVHVGQHVKRGDIIAYMGNSGKSTGPHLHYEVHQQGQPVNPRPFILPEDQIVD